MVLSRTARLTGLVLVAGLASSCCLVQEPTLEEQTTEIASLRSELEEEWAALGADLAEVEADVQHFAANTMDYGDLEPDVLREAIRASLDEKSRQGAAGDELMATPAEELAAALESADEATRTAAETTVATGSTVYEQLEVALPKGVKGLLWRAGKAGRLGFQAQAEATVKKECAHASKLMSDQALAQLDAEYAAIEADVDELEAYAEGIPDLAKGYSERIQQALVEFELRLANLGSSN